MPWLIPLLALLGGTGLQMRSQKAKENAIAQGTARATGRESKRQQKFDAKARQLGDQAQDGLQVENQQQNWDEAAGQRKAFYAESALKPADAGYQSPAADGPRVIADDSARTNKLADVFLANTGDARATLSGYGDMQQKENMRLAPVARDINRNRQAARNSANLLPAEIQAAVARGMTKGRNSANWGQLLSTLGAAGLAAGGIPFPGANPATATVVADSAVPGAMSAAGGMEMSLAPTLNPFQNAAATAARTKAAAPGLWADSMWRKTLTAAGGF